MEGSDQIMPDTSIQAFQPNDGALSAEHYQTFELAKEHDGILGSSDIAQIRTYAAYARAQAQTIHKTIAKTNGIEDVAAIKSEATETAQTFAKVSIYADQRIGEILRELPTGHGNRFSDTSETLKADAIADAGIPKSQAYDLQKLAANPDVVQAVLEQAEAEGRIPSRKQVLDAIRERDDARETVSMVKKVSDALKRQRDEAREDNEKYKQDVKDLQEEIRALEKQNDQLYERANELDAYIEQHPQHPVVERVHTVEVESEAAKKRISDLEHLEQLHSSDNQRLRRKLEDMRKELDKAKVLIGEKQRNDSAEWDIAALTTATNNYLRQYGGKAWAFDQFYRVDETTQAEFVKAINNLAAFAQNLAQMIKEQSDE